MIDYKDLLRKYIQHVGECEGISYIHALNHSYMSKVLFSDEEVNALQALESDG